MHDRALKRGRLVRPLTLGEIKLAKEVFQHHLDYETVKIYQGAFLRFGLQKPNIAMAPNGKIYFPLPSYQADFSKGTDAQKICFMHEMTHVWQYQNGISVIFRGLWLALLGGYVGKRWVYWYFQEKNLSKRFTEFNIEQQACIVADFFLLRYLNVPISQDQAVFVTELVEDTFGLK